MTARPYTLWIFLATVLLTLVGCGSSNDARQAALRTKLVLASAPAGAMTIDEARAKVEAKKQSAAAVEERAATLQVPAGPAKAGAGLIALAIVPPEPDDAAAHDHADHDHAAHDHAGHDHAHEHPQVSKLEGTPVVVRAVIGGSIEPWDDGHAAFLITPPGAATTAAADDHDHAEHAGHTHDHGDDCLFCKKAAVSTAIVQFLDEQGKVIEHDSRQLFGLAAGDEVVVRGQATLDTLGNLIIAADGMYVAK